MTKRKPPKPDTPPPSHANSPPFDQSAAARTPRLSRSQKAHINPEDDIGPFFKVFASFWGFVGGSLLVFHAMQGRPNTWIDFGILVSIVMLVIGLVRPKKFDGAMKTAASAIPLLKFKKD